MVPSMGPSYNVAVFAHEKGIRNVFLDTLMYNLQSSPLLLSPTGSTQRMAQKIDTV
jgi:hypothetical protein